MTQQHKIIFRTESGEDTIVFSTCGVNLLELIQNTGINFDAPCSGSGSCGKCRVRLLEGSLGGSTSRHISDNDWENGWRLACTSVTETAAIVLIPDAALAFSNDIKAGENESLSVLKTTLYELAQSFGDSSANSSDNGTDDVFSDSDYGLAIDIGTTTVSAILVKLKSREIIKTRRVGNNQIRYGADVIHRIIEQVKPGGMEKLQRAIVVETLIPLIDSLCSEAKIMHSQICRMTIASNTTMNHLLLGINADSIRLEPYKPAFLVHEPFSPELIGIELAPSAKVYLSPNVGSYVGGDITAGTLACKLYDSPELSVLIDLGTNGEIVFGNNDFLLTCACSAGPAFEGGDISFGMRASDGAIEACEINVETMEPSITVIGSKKPAGICGSGIIDIVAELFRAGVINGKGKFIREGSRIKRDEYGTGRYILAFAENTESGCDISITETDLDNFIRAKGAVFSALLSLVRPIGFEIQDIERIMVAGGIGSGINIKNAIRIGLLPNLPEEKYRYIGNSSLAGAFAMLVSEKAGEQLGNIASNMTYIELSTQPGYMDEFIAACFLPHTDERMFI